MKGEVDELIEAGVRPAKIKKQLAKKHESVLIPSVKQIHNRRVTIIGQPESGWQITRMEQLDAWMDAHLIDRFIAYIYSFQNACLMNFEICSKENFEAITDQSAVIVLGKFKDGFVFSTKKLLGTLKFMVGAQGKHGGSVSTDCTFNLTSGNC